MGYLPSMSLHFRLPDANVTSALRLSKRISTGVSSWVSAFLSSVAGFLRQDERHRLFVGDAQYLVSHELVSVACHDCQCLLVEVKIETVHHRPDFLVSCGKQCTRDVVGEDAGWYGDCRCPVAYWLCHREFIGILCREGIASVLECNAHGVGVQV